MKNEFAWFIIKNGQVVKSGSDVSHNKAMDAMLLGSQGMENISGFLYSTKTQNVYNWCFSDRVKPSKRTMTKEEYAGWAYNEGATGWEVTKREEGFGYRQPVHWNGINPALLKRRRVYTNGYTSEWEGCEVDQ